ncbi:glycosyltransferase [Lyngbya aestuarii]|uniref:glycosyltransferase n=1 Tax=Lyngbya aestuarii TaxID=118322 RepID=UPI00403DAFB5
MRILQVHNAYTHSGGEEAVVAAEYAMLKQYGHEVYQWIVNSSTVHEANALAKAKIAINSVWSGDSYVETKKILQEYQPDVVHVHNTIPLISPSVYAACRSSGVPVVHTLHNYKLICPGAYLYRQGRVCEECVDKSVRYPGLVHGCYRNNRTQTAIAVTGLTINQLRKTYQSDVDIYIALTRFARQKFIEGGLPPDKIAVKPNFVTSDIQPGRHAGGYALFAGKLMQYKGVETLLRAWDLLNEPIPLKVVGQGPLEILFKSNLPRGVEYLGRIPREQVLSLMQEASFVVFPSEWYEGFPMTIAEAFATATPVVASRMAAMAEIVRDGSSGWHFTPGDAQDLANTVQAAWSDPSEVSRRGALARRQYDECYSLEKNYQMTISIYKTAIEWFKGRSSATVF